MDGYNFNQDQNNYYGTPDEPMGTNTAFAKTAFILGFVALGLAFSIMFSSFGIMAGTAGLFFAIMSGRRGKGIPKKGRTAIICSIVAIVISLLIMTLVISVLVMDGSLVDMWTEYMNLYEQMSGESIYSNLI